MRARGNRVCSWRPWRLILMLDVVLGTIRSTGFVRVASRNEQLDQTKNTYIGLVNQEPGNVFRISPTGCASRR
jgi:hypothetical protein